MTGNRKQLDKPIQVKALHKNKLIFEKVFDSYPIVIGRGSACDVPLTQFDFISRQHAVITIEDGQAHIVDLNSSNGIYFQGQKFKKAPIEGEVQITIGEVVFYITISEIMLDATQVDERTSKIELNEKGQLIAAQADDTTPNQPEIIPEQLRAIKDMPGDLKLNESNSVPSISKLKIDQIQVVKEQPKKGGGIHVNGNGKAPATNDRAKQYHLAQAQINLGHHHHEKPEPILNMHGTDQIAPHPLANELKPHHRVLEGYVTWKDVIYDVQQFGPGEKVTLGTGYRASLSVPTLQRNVKIAKYDGLATECYIPNGVDIEVQRDNKKIKMSELLASQALVSKKNGYILKLGNKELCSIKLTDDLQVHLRYAPAPRQLSKKQLIEASEEFRKATIVSIMMHFLLASLALLNAPENHGPKMKGVQERYARLLVEPPRKIIEPPKKKEPKKKEPEKVVQKKQPEKQKVVKVQQKIPQKVKLTKPVVATKTAALPVKKEVNVQAVGALAALTALAPAAAPSNQPVAININPNAGGMTSKSATGGVIGVLKSKGGQLVAGGGLPGVKTKGLGYGTGTGYGIQGLKGTAGNRAVAGSVVGTPALMTSGKTEGISKAAVMEVVKKHVGEIQQCYERALFNNPGLAGRVSYEWEISPSGKVNWAKVQKSEIGDADALNSCVTAIFKKMVFPVAKNGQTTTPNIGFPFGRL